MDKKIWDITKKQIKGLEKEIDYMYDAMKKLDYTKMELEKFIEILDKFHSGIAVFYDYIIDMQSQENEEKIKRE